MFFGGFGVFQGFGLLAPLVTESNLGREVSRKGGLLDPPHALMVAFTNKNYHTASSLRSEDISVAYRHYP